MLVIIVLHMTFSFAGMSEEEVQDMLLSVEIDKRGEIDYKGSKSIVNYANFVCDGKILST